MKTFEVNGKSYKAKAFDFNLVCDLEDMGISMSTASDKPSSMARAYFAICANMSKEDAGKEIEEHVKNGGNLNDVMITMSEELEKSDFFRSLTQTTEAENGQSKSKAK